MSGDDGVGIAVLERLRSTAMPADISLHACVDPAAIPALLEGAGHAVLIDAFVGGGQPGDVRCFTENELASGGVRTLSTHGINVTAALALARTLDAARAPADIRIVGVCIEPPRSPGPSLSHAVAAAVDRAVAMVRRIITEPSDSDTATKRWAIRVRGVVQGVGFRPFVYRAATARGLTGWVRNENGRVRIEAQGPPAALRAFVDDLRERHPDLAGVDSIETSAITPADDSGFRIAESDGASSHRPALPPDVATCAECLAEVRTPGERRHRYPFTNCTACGPRYSIVEQTPYDRPRTSMRRFDMCPACDAEYRNPLDRRFHAQPIACPECGPQLELRDTAGGPLAERDQALRQAAQALLAGRIIALKGLGGYQLLVDATNEDAVVRLRRRKHREEKPLALMMRSLGMIAQYCAVSDAELAALHSPAAPILLLRRATNRSDIATSVAPGNPYLGVMLPYTPLHHLLLESVDRPLVCTSGNLSEEPMCIDDDDALKKLGAIADLLLVHDRPIVRQVDDSVARVDAEGLQLLRRARGFSPLPIDIGLDGPPLLAVGGHLKNTVALRLGSQAIVSQHVGDLDSPAGRAAFERTIDDLLSFFNAAPAAIACDLHPDYASTLHAERLAAERNVPLIRVQHHHAHVVSAMAEHGLDGDVLGLSWDGTGYGTDATIWGGEALAGDAINFRRIAHLRPFPLPGGEAAVRDPRRSAVGLLYATLGDEAFTRTAAWFDDAECRTLRTMLRRRINTPITTSMGRLFDAVAALTGVASHIGYEGQAAMMLEFAADGIDTDNAYPLPLRAGGPAIADTEPMVRGVLTDIDRGAPPSIVSAKFHNALAEWASAVADSTGLPRVVLSGGCFQNARLSGSVRRRLLEAGYTVYTQRRVPPNDGGISLGQLLSAARQIERR